MLDARQRRVTLFALHRFVREARNYANMAAQDKQCRSFKAGALEHFMKDAADGEAAIKIIEEANGRADTVLLPTGD